MGIENFDFSYIKYWKKTGYGYWKFEFFNTFFLHWSGFPDSTNGLIDRKMNFSGADLTHLKYKSGIIWIGLKIMKKGAHIYFHLSHNPQSIG